MLEQLGQRWYLLGRCRGSRSSPEGSAVRRRAGRRPSRAGHAGRRELPVAPPPPRGRAAEGLSLGLGFCRPRRRPPRTLTARPRPSPARPLCGRGEGSVSGRAVVQSRSRALRPARPRLATAGRHLPPGSPVTRGCRDAAFKRGPYPASPPCKNTWLAQNSKRLLITSIPSGFCTPAPIHLVVPPILQFFFCLPPGDPGPPIRVTRGGTAGHSAPGRYSCSADTPPLKLQIIRPLKS